MSLVNTETGELIEPMDVDSARRLTERLRLAATNYTDAKVKVLQLVDEAKAGSAHLALGYKSWTAYLSDVLSDEPLRLAREDRRELVTHLADQGMSQRAIAPIVGVSHRTVNSDLAESQLESSVPVDGRTPPPVVRDITGMNGKTYTSVTAGRLKPRPAPRRALPDQFFEAAYDLTKVAERIDRLVNDDRFPQNAEKVGAKHRTDLLRAVELLSKALDRLV